MTAALCVLFAIGLFALAVLAARETFGGARPALATNLHLLSLGLILVVLLTPGLWYDAETYFGDLTTALEAVHKARQGLVSSRDYFSPIGPAMGWVYRVTLLVHAPSARSIVLGNALVALVALGLSILLLRRRATPLTVAIAGLIAVTTAVSPRDIDLQGLQSSFLAPYNRWAWALLVPVALRAALPLVGADRAGAWAMGPAIGLLLLLKVTYGLAAIGILGVASLLQRRAWQEVAIAAAGCAAALVVVDTLSGGQVRFYLGDLRAAGAMPANGLRLQKFLTLVSTFLLFGAGCLILALAAARRHSEAAGDALRGRSTGLALAFATGLAGIVVLMQNHYNTEATTLLLLPLIVGEWSGLLAGRDVPHGLWLPKGEWLLLVLLVTLARPALDSGMTILQPLQLMRKPQDRAFAGSEFGDLIVEATHRPDADGQCFDGTCMDYRRMLDGRDLLRRACRPRAGAAVLAANFWNPYPALLGIPSPRGSPIWLHQNRSISVAVHPAYDRMLAGVDCLIEARHEDNSSLFMTIYRTDLHRQFRPVAQNDDWIVWKRIGDAAPLAGTSAPLGQ